MYNECLYDPVLLIQSPGDLPEELVLQKKYTIALQIDNFDLTNERTRIKSLIEGEAGFFLVIAPDKALTGQADWQKIYDIISLCFVSRNYVRELEMPAIAFLHSGPAGATGELQQQLLHGLQRQGWPGIKNWDLYPGLSLKDQITQNRGVPFFISRIDFDESFLLRNFFTRPEYAGEPIIFIEPDPERTRLLEATFSRLCESAINTVPLIRTYLGLYLDQKKDILRLKKDNGVITERLANADSTISVIRTKYKDDYDLLFDWYHKEYEVLPLWYKRFGHIIKVFQGKRTLKSLWSKDKSQSGH